MKISGPIILVDDDPDDHEIIRAVCEELGVCDQVVFYENGYDLLKFLKSTDVSPFVILCDINMPMMDGMALRKIIEGDAYLKRKAIPFIFFSTSATPEQVKSAYDMTVQGFFVKGASFEETKRKLRTILAYWSDCKHPNSSV